MSSYFNLQGLPNGQVPIKQLEAPWYSGDIRYKVRQRQNKILTAFVSTQKSICIRSSSRILRDIVQDLSGPPRTQKLGVLQRKTVLRSGFCVLVGPDQSFFPKHNCVADQGLPTLGANKKWTFPLTTQSLLTGVTHDSPLMLVLGSCEQALEG